MDRKHLRKLPINTNENGLDSYYYSLALRLTDNYHNELLNDPMPALKESTAEMAASKYFTDIDKMSSGNMAFRVKKDNHMRIAKRLFSVMLVSVVATGTLLAGCGSTASSSDSALMVSANAKKTSKKTKKVKRKTAKRPARKKATQKESRNMKGDTVTVGTRRDRGFIIDNVLHSKSRGDIHFSSYVPDSYTGKEKYALFISLPGWEGEYPQGVGSNLQEFFPFEAQKYNKKMIIISPQLMGWDEDSADDTIALTEYLLSTYNINRDKVYLEGYSGGGETGSIAVGMRPDLYTAWLMGSSQWDGDYDSVVKAELPVYLAVGEGDSYYGSGPLKKAYNELHRRYVKKGLPESQISKLLVLDVKPASYFTSQGFTDQHAGGQAFANDKTIMSWLFEK